MSKFVASKINKIENENSIEDFDFTMNCEIPRHSYFIKESIKWDLEYEYQNKHNKVSKVDYLFPKKIGIDVLDTMLILTDNKLLLIRGLYSYYGNDTIRMPHSGEFGVNFNVMDNKGYSIGSTKYIYFNNIKYILHPKVEYQWWCLIKDKLDSNKDNSIVVSGP